MDRIKIVGGSELKGEIPISGAKNATLPLMIASLLTDETLTLSNVPRLRDVAQLMQILSNHGVDYAVNGKRNGQDELVECLVDAYNGTGTSVTWKENVHKMAEANKAYAHYAR